MPEFHPILTTDYFEYGTTVNRLDRDGAAVEMGDAALGLACAELRGSAAVGGGAEHVGPGHQRCHAGEGVQAQRADHLGRRLLHRLRAVDQHPRRTRHLGLIAGLATQPQPD